MGFMRHWSLELLLAVIISCTVLEGGAVMIGRKNSSPQTIRRSIEAEGLSQCDTSSREDIPYATRSPQAFTVDQAMLIMLLWERTTAMMATVSLAGAAFMRHVDQDPDLYTENIEARLWRTALTGSPSLGDEHGWPQYTQGSRNNTPHLDEPQKPGTWANLSASSWTAGFFPDSLWQIYHRRKSLLHQPFEDQPDLDEWLEIAQHWTDPLITNSNLTNTHDLGFLAKPFESGLHYNNETKWLPVLANMSDNLAARFLSKAGIIRSWDTDNSTYTQRGSHEDSVLVIIDNMMNLALLSRSAISYTGNQTHLEIVRSHADKTRDHHVRPDGSSYHVCDYSATTGELYLCRTAQGLADNSTWARGQAWGIYGFAEVYSFVGDDSYLATSMKMADWFLDHLPEDGVPFWDFDAPYLPNITPRDSSAVMIAASGMILLQEQIEKQREQQSEGRNYRDAAVKLLRDTLALTLAGEISFSDIKSNSAAEVGAITDVTTPAGTEQTKGFEAILLHATANNNPQAGDGKNYDSGLVYGDFYLIEAGNRLLKQRQRQDWAFP